MPPDSSKNRSRTMVCCVGSTPSAARLSARYAIACSAAANGMPVSSASHATAALKGCATGAATARDSLAVASVAQPFRAASTSARRSLTARESSSLLARAAPRAHAAVHLVAMDERTPPAASGRKSFRGHRDHGVEAVAREIAIRPRPPDECEQIVLRVVAARRLRDDLLRQDVERRIVADDAVELAAADR